MKKQASAVFYQGFSQSSFLKRFSELEKPQAMKHWFRHLKVGHKIGLGYAIAVGIAVGGTVMGTFVGNHYENQALLHREDALQELYLYNAFQTKLLHSEIHQRRLLAMIYDGDQQREQEERVQEEIIAEIKLDAAAVEQFWTELKESYQNPEVEEMQEELEIFSGLIEHHDKLLSTYPQRTEDWIESVRQYSQSSADDTFVELDELTFTNNFLIKELNQLVEELEKVVEAVEEEDAAAEAALLVVTRLRTRILIFSLSVSIVIASIFALLTSRAITRPLETSTHVAEQVVKQANFDLQVAITSHDEVGRLSQSLNHLIQWMKQLLIEQEAAKTQLVHAEKMSSLGQLVAGVAHEINNPVNFIHGNIVHANQYAQDLLSLVKLYQQYYPNTHPNLQDKVAEFEFEFLQEDFPKLLSSMEMGTRRIRGIVQSLRNFSRLDEADFKSVDIHEGIESTLLILQHRLKEKSDHPAIQVIRDYSPLPAVKCYPGQLNQVFMNLLTNAIDALEEYFQKGSGMKEHSGTIRIQTNIIRDQWVAIHIADNGPGMTTNICEKLFDPFFTTKPVGKGTGLGLSISYQIVVEHHRGQLKCISAPGQGTEFVIQIPADPEKACSAN